MKKLLLLSHNYHSFLLNEISFAINNFDKVHVLTIFNKEIYNNFSQNNKVELHLFKKKDLYLAAFTRLYSIFSKENLSEILYTYRDNKISVKYLKEFLMYLAIEKICIKNSRKIGVNTKDCGDWRALACWYSSDAYALFKLKKKFPDLKIYSLAHSYEVDRVKNDCVSHLFRKEYHPYFSKICFISRNVEKHFALDVANELTLDIQNVEVKYLGTIKKENGLNICNKEAPYHIVTCSYVTPVKRVEDIYFTLREYADIPIVWTHIGKGEFYDSLIDKVRLNDNINLKVKLLGELSNDCIHKLYSKNRIDLFLNFSLSEGIPVSIMEAIAYGIPVIATNVGGNSEIVNDKFGLLVDVDISRSNLWSKIKRICTLEYKIKEEFSKNAHEFFEKEFNANNIRDNFYRGL